MPMPLSIKLHRIRSAAMRVERFFRSLTDLNAEGHAVRRPQLFRDLIALTESRRESSRHHRRVALRRSFFPDPRFAAADHRRNDNRYQSRAVHSLLEAVGRSAGRLVQARSTTA